MVEGRSLDMLWVLERECLWGDTKPEGGLEVVVGSMVGNTGQSGLQVSSLVSL